MELASIDRVIFPTMPDRIIAVQQFKQFGDAINDEDSRLIFNDNEELKRRVSPGAFANSFLKGAIPSGRLR